MSAGEELLQPTSDSFWEIDGYRRTVRRVEDGAAQCTELMKLVQERADIEKEYAKKLKAWTKKWNDNFDKGPEYGSNKATLKGALDEADQIADVHLAVKDRLLSDIQSQIKDWKNDNYKKQIVGTCKEAKTFEEDFRKAQKPWGKRLGKLMKAKKEYHMACKLERTATNQENNARNSSDVSPDQLKKLQEKLEKCRKDVESSRDRYQQSLNELNGYNAKYVEDMTEVYQRTQDFELKRLNFCKKLLYDLHACLDITQNKKLHEIYAQLRQTVDQLDPSYDLKFWSQTHGVDMAMAWPQFEEYSTEAHSITNRETVRNTVALDNHVRLTSVQPSGPMATASAPPPSQNTTSAAAFSMSTSSSQNPFGDDDWETAAMYQNASDMHNGQQQQQPHQTTTSNNSGFSSSFSAAPSVGGVAVRALFDYVGQEDDELSFHVGEVFLKTRDKDDQGWCTGLKDGRLGLYPDNYVEIV